MLNYAGAAARSPFRNIIAHKPAVPPFGSKGETEDVEGLEGSKKERGNGGKARKKNERELVSRASIKRIAERSISLIISGKGCA